MSSLRSPLDVAIELAEKAGPLIRNNFRLGIARETKADGSPVTEVDLAINKMVVRVLSTEFPDYAIVGEEQSRDIAGAEYTWVCDPLDGTIPFTHGIPMAAFSLALCRNGVPVLAVVNDPFSERLFVAERGCGAAVNGESIDVSRRSVLGGALVNCALTPSRSYSAPGLLDELLQRNAELLELGSAVSAGVLVACGQMEVVAFGHASPWDGAALALLVEEAGGRATDLFGQTQRYDQPLRGFLATNGAVHDEMVELIGAHLASAPAEGR